MGLCPTPRQTLEKFASNSVIFSTATLKSGTNKRATTFWKKVVPKTAWLRFAQLFNSYWLRQWRRFLLRRNTAQSIVVLCGFEASFSAGPELLLSPRASSLSELSKLSSASSLTRGSSSSSGPCLGQRPRHGPARSRGLRQAKREFAHRCSTVATLLQLNQSN